MHDDDPPDPPVSSSIRPEVLGQFSWGVVVIFALATVCWGLLPYTGPYFSAVVFLLAVVLAGTQWNRGPVLMMAGVSALTWNFLFIPPRLTLHIDNPQDVVMFVLFFVVALSMGHLTTRLQAREEELERTHREREELLEAKHLAERVAESERLHRTLLDSVSHELKTPIAIIRTAVDGLAPDNPYVIEIDTATRRLQRIVENLLEITRVESEGLKPCPDWCEVSDVLHAATLPLQRELATHRIRLIGAADLPLLKLDSGLLAQALGLVLHNATIYAPVGSEIEVYGALNGDVLELRVRDHGPGVPPWAFARIFEKFYRTPGSPAGGTGLGLAIARGLMRAMQGDITAGNHPDGGAEFRLWLPVSVSSDGSASETSIS